MNSEEIIQKLASHNIELYLVDDCKLKAKAPKGAITGELAGIIKDNKSALVNYLQQLDNISGEQSRSTQIQAIARGLDKLPVSFAQRRLWFIDSLQGGSPEYNMPMAFDVNGQLDTGLVTEVFNTILERHEVLRTVYFEENGETLQQIRNMSDVAFDIKVEDLSHLAGESLEQQVKQLVETDIASPFNLASDLMLRVSYVKKTAATGVMIFNMHHIASDGWSMEVLAKEFFALYAAYSRGQVNPLPALDIQYVDYAHWQREYLEGEVLESQLSYWQKQLADLPVVHSLPLDNARPAIKQHQGAVVTGELSATTATKLLNVAKEHKLTPFMLLHGALSLLLSRHSNSADVVIGTPVANRRQAEIEPLIGFFVNTLVLRADTGHDTLSDYFAHIRQVHLDAQSNQDVPFEQLVERLKVPRSTAHSPLFQIMMSTNTDYGLDDGANMASFSLPGMDIQPYQSSLIQAKFDLEVSLRISEQGVGLNWTYDIGLFTEQHIARLNAHLCHLLEGLSQTQGQPQQALHTLPLLSADEIQYLVHDVNETAMDYPKASCIHELFEQQAQAHPEQLALVFENKQLSYQALNERANQLARYLKEQHQITPDTLVGLCVERSLEMVIGILAILKAGGAYVPLDPNYPQERLRYMLEDAALEVVLSQTKLQQVLAGFNGTILALDGLGDSGQHFCCEYASSNLCTKETGLSASDLAYVIYTSGSTGQPKGVMVEHASVVNYQQHVKKNYGLTQADNFLQFSNISFDIFIEEVFGALSQGARLTLRDEACQFDIRAFIDFCNQYEISIVSLPTAFWAQIVATQEQLPTTSLRAVIVGGEALSVSTVANHYQLFTTDVALINSYGPTEATVTATSYVTSLADGSSTLVPIGKANINNQLFVLDQDKALCPLNCVGELYIGGQGLARGYLNRPELTLEAFIDNPFYDESKPGSSPRLYRTGDLVRYLADGNLEFVGRIDDQVKIRGFRIELAEVEAQLTRLDMVESALVMAKELAGSRQLVGYVKPQQGGADTADYLSSVKAALAQVLPEYMVPGMLMVIETWPLTPNGKLDKKSLPVPDGAALQGEYVAPETATEQVLAEIWAGLLNIAPESVSATANFFELGGHSLLCIRLVSEIRNRLEVEISVQDVFNYAGLQAMATVIGQSSRAAVRPPLSAVERSSDQVPVSFAQQRLWFIDSLQGGSPEYNMPMAFDVTGRLNTALVADVFNTIFERHEVLRTVFVEEGGETLQHIRSMSDICFEILEHDLTDLTGELLDNQVKALVEKDIMMPFNLAEDLMLRVSYVRKTADTGVMIFNMHHIASDGWSMEVLIKEFFALYQAYRQGEANPLPGLEVQYADYTSWQRDYLQGDVLESQFNYWQQQLAELPAVHSLPLDYPRPAIKQHKGAAVTGELPATIAKNLLEVAKAHKLTPFMLLHGALSLLLSRHSNSSDIVIGTPVANRLQAEIEPLIGFFVNTLVLRADTRHKNLSDYFAHIRQVHLDAQSNQDVPFEQLVDRLKAPRSTAHSPVFQIMMTTNTDYGLNDASDMASFTLPDVDIQPYTSDLIQAKFDLNIDLSISEQGVGLYWNYDTSLFTEQHIVQLNGHLCRLLEGLSQTLGQHAARVNALPLLSSGEIQHLVHDLNDTGMDYQKEKCIHQLFEQQARENPEYPAVVFEDKQLTYRELNEKANQLAHYLTRQYDIKADTLVGLCVERSLEMVIGVLAILKTGGCYVPFDIEHGAEILNARLTSLDIAVTLFSETTRGLIENDTIEQCNIGQLLADAGNLDTGNLDLVCKPESLAYAMTSSGTTGKPKLIGLPHRALNNLIVSMTTQNTAIKGAHRVLQFASIGFDMSFTDMALALLQGGSLYLIPESKRFDVKALVDLVTHHEISVLNLPASMLKVVSEISLDQQIKLPSIRAVISTAEKLEITEKLKAFFELNEQACLVNHFGPTETHVCTTFNLPESPGEWPQEVPIGQPVGNTGCFVLDHNQALVPKGACGELYVGGDCLAVGYLGNAGLTGEKFIETELPGIGLTRLYRTGDLVKWEKDQLIYAGRADDQLKINGYRIELEDIKQQMKLHPDVINATLVYEARLDHLIGYYSSDVLDDAELRSYLNDNMPSYMVPRYLVKVDEFKLTVNGKIDKRSLPALDESYLQGEYVAPETLSEIQLAGIWSAVLGLAQAQIGANSNFFELGGTSIGLIKVLHQIQETFEINILVEKLYQFQDLSSLSAFIDEENALKNMTETEGGESQWEI